MFNFAKLDFLNEHDVDLKSDEYNVCSIYFQTYSTFLFSLI